MLGDLHGVTTVVVMLSWMTIPFSKRSMKFHKRMVHLFFSHQFGQLQYSSHKWLTANITPNVITND